VSLRDAGFETDAQNAGTWTARHPLGGGYVDVDIDLIVPEAVGGPGRRGARRGVHGKKAARKAKGLEAAYVDRQVRSIGALEDTDPQVLKVALAGPAALLVAKLHKIAERVDSPHRSRNKDALDVFRLLQSVPTETLADGIRKLLASGVAAGITEESVGNLRNLFSEPSRTGCQMAARAAAPLESEETIATSCAILAEDLLQEIHL